jgi:hypothetical protein
MKAPRYIKNGKATLRHSFPWRDTSLSHEIYKKATVTNSRPKKKHVEKYGQTETRDRLTRVLLLFGKPWRPAIEPLLPHPWKDRAWCKRAHQVQRRVFLPCMWARVCAMHVHTKYNGLWIGFFKQLSPLTSIHRQSLPFQTWTDRNWVLFPRKCTDLGCVFESSGYEV